jgi:hypothetical protein
MTYNKSLNTVRSSSNSVKASSRSLSVLWTNAILLSIWMRCRLFTWSSSVNQIRLRAVTSNRSSANSMYLWNQRNREMILLRFETFGIIDGIQLLNKVVQFDTPKTNNHATPDRQIESYSVAKVGAHRTVTKYLVKPKLVWNEETLYSA